MEIAFKHYPALANTGIKTVVNGPFTFSPDGNPLVGRGNATMRSQVVQESDGKKKLTFNTTELKQVAAYLAALPGDLRVVPQSRFR